MVRRLWGLGAAQVRDRLRHISTSGARDWAGRGADAGALLVAHEIFAITREQAR